MKIRKMKVEDIEGILSWMNDQGIIKYFRLNEKSKNRDSVLRFINHSFTELNQHFAIADDNDEYLGTVSLKNINNIELEAEVAIVLTRKNIGKGNGKFALKEILKYAKCELHLKRIYLNVFDDNIRAKELYEKVGFAKYDCSEVQIDGEARMLDWYEYNLFSINFDCSI